MVIRDTGGVGNCSGNSMEAPRTTPPPPPIFYVIHHLLCNGLRGHDIVTLAWSQMSRACFPGVDNWTTVSETIHDMFFEGIRTTGELRV